MTRPLILTFLLAGCLGPSDRGSGGDSPGGGGAGGGAAQGGGGGGGDDGLDIVGEGEAPGGDDAGAVGEGEAGGGEAGETGGGGDGGEDGAGADGSGGDVDIPRDHPDLEACGAAPLVGAGPHEVSAETRAGAGAGLSSSCNDQDGASGPDALWIWVPPATGTYRIATEASDFDTVLAIREPTCEQGSDGENVLRCHDDIDPGRIQWSRIVDTFEAGEAVLIAVDGFAADNSGTVRLTIDRAEGQCEDGVDGDGDGDVDCDDSDCSSAPVCRNIDCPGAALEGVGRRVDGSTSSQARGALGAGSVLGDASCGRGGGGAPEAAFSFEAPHDGRFVFSTAGSRFDTIMYVRDRWCSGRELACDDDGAGDGASKITLDLEEGQEIVVVVDGFDDKSGQFRLTVSGVEMFCDDGEDDDGDGAVDCDDDDCFSIECATGGAWPESWADNEEEMLTLVNERRAAGARCAQDWYPAADPLEMNEFLRLSSRLHSLDMGRRNYFEHENLDGLSPNDRMVNAGFRGSFPTGENISAGYATAEASVEGLMNSPGHCRNIMNPDYRVVGYGYAHTPGSDFGHYWTQNFGGSH